MDDISSIPDISITHYNRDGKASVRAALNFQRAFDFPSGHRYNRRRVFVRVPGLPYPEHYFFLLFAPQK